YLVKVGVKLVKAMEDFEDDDTASHDNVDIESSNEKNLDLIED
ncbi:MAG: hypothetical protein ACI863_000799, partial [Flavobacteriales bacterium]